MSIVARMPIWNDQYLRKDEERRKEMSGGYKKKNEKEKEEKKSHLQTHLKNINESKQ